MRSIASWTNLPIMNVSQFLRSESQRHRQITARISRHLAANTARADIPCAVTSVTQCDANERVGEAGARRVVVDLRTAVVVHILYEDTPLGGEAGFQQSGHPVTIHLFGTLRMRRIEILKLGPQREFRRKLIGHVRNENILWRMTSSPPCIAFFCNDTKRTVRSLLFQLLSMSNEKSR